MKKTLLSLLCVPVLAAAQAGAFDTSFAGTGKKTLYVQEEMTRSNRIVALPDGSILTAGYSYAEGFNGGAFSGVFVNKHLENGDTDTSFGNNGTVYLTNYASANSVLSALKVQPDGKILISGGISGQGELRRLNANGSPDTAFGTNGVVSVAPQYVGCMALAANGKIVVAGQYWNGEINVYKIFRYNANGSADTTFGNNGIVLADVTPYKFDLALDVVIQPDNKIVVAGQSYLNLENAVISRFNENGTPDTGFANNGVFIIPLSPDQGNGTLEKVVLQPDGKIVAAGHAIGIVGTGGFNSSSPAVVRLNTDGSLDSTFGTGGKVILPTIYNANDSFTALHLQNDGKILAGGYAGYPFPFMRSHYYLARLTSAGVYDPTFGVGGRLLYDFTNSDGDYINYLQDIDLMADGRIVTTGFTGPSSVEEMQMIICRFKNDDIMSVNNAESPVFTVYPNPVADNINVTLPAGSCAVSIYNMQGQQVFSQSRESFTGSIAVDGLASGSYILKLVSDTGTVSEKIVKR